MTKLILPFIELENYDESIKIGGTRQINTPEAMSEGILYDDWSNKSFE